MTKRFVNELEKDEAVDSKFVVIEKNQIKPYANGFWFTIRVADKTGQVLVKYWGSQNEEEVKAKFSSFEIDNVVQIKGFAGEYKGNKEISVNPPNGDIIKTLEYDEGDFVASSEKNIDEMKSQLLKIISDVKNPDIKLLLESFFLDKEFMEKFAKSPAASTRHHNFRGGLIEHVLSLIQLSKDVVKIHTELDIDLLTAGCIFHDIGKIEEYHVSLGISYTDKGRLFGHISIGQQLVSEKISKLEGFSPIIGDKIIHMILSHHGIKEWGSPVTPAFPEAVALHYIDQVDAKIKGILQEKKNVNTNEDWIWTRDYGDVFLK